MMTFRNSLYLSIAAHVLIFSSAIAVAQYAGGNRASSLPAIQVSLISLSPGPRGGARTIKRQGIRPRTAEPHLHEVMSEPKQAVPHELPVDLSEISEVSDAAHSPVSDTIGDDVAVNVPGQEISSAFEGGGENASRGSIAQQQWTAIQTAIERTKNYPRLARERGIEGEVRLRFRLNSSGNVEAVEVVKSSGYEILDSASIRAVYRAAPMPSVRGWIEVPMAYVLK
jgi:protein TonB